MYKFSPARDNIIVKRNVLRSSPHLSINQNCYKELKNSEYIRLSTSTRACVNNLKLNTRWQKDPMLEHFQGEAGNNKGRILGKPNRNIYGILELRFEVHGLV